MNVEFFIRHYRRQALTRADAFVKRNSWWRNAHPRGLLSTEELAAIDRPTAAELEELAASMGETTD